MGCGFGNLLMSEAQAGAVPLEQNSPQRPPLGLYAEQLSGQAFVQPRSQNFKTWLYRLLPSVSQVTGNWERVFDLSRSFLTPPFVEGVYPPYPLRWPPEEPGKKCDFLDGLKTLCGAGALLNGVAIHRYVATQNMERFFVNHDGHLLIVPYRGGLRVRTEFGTLEVAPAEFVLIPKGVVFCVELLNKESAGYVGENLGSPFVLPELGVLGANGLANPRHFEAPQASFVDKEGDFTKIVKLGGVFWRVALSRHPLDVVGWVGNYWPTKYDLRRFNTLGSISYDHPDPSIFTVLTSSSATPYQPHMDFVVFPPRWLVAEHTFRPPYFHRNVMSEFMGLVYGVYDAKPSGRKSGDPSDLSNQGANASNEEGFQPGGASLHNAFVPHGPDAEATKIAQAKEDLTPEFLDNTLAFMFETRQPLALPKEDNESGETKSYAACWEGLTIGYGR